MGFWLTSVVLGCPQTVGFEPTENHAIQGSEPCVLHFLLHFAGFSSWIVYHRSHNNGVKNYILSIFEINF